MEESYHAHSPTRGRQKERTNVAKKKERNETNETDLDLEFMNIYGLQAIDILDLHQHFSRKLRQTFGDCLFSEKKINCLSRRFNSKRNSRNSVLLRWKPARLAGTNSIGVDLETYAITGGLGNRSFRFEAPWPNGVDRFSYFFDPRWFCSCGSKGGVTFLKG